MPRSPRTARAKSTSKTAATKKVTFVVPPTSESNSQSGSDCRQTRSMSRLRATTEPGSSSESDLDSDPAPTRKNKPRTPTIPRVSNPPSGQDAKKRGSSRLNFEKSLPVDAPPLKRGIVVEGKGATPLYALGWKLDTCQLAEPVDMLREQEYYRRRCRPTMDKHPNRSRIPQPQVMWSIGGAMDGDFYFIAATNASRDPASITIDDCQVAKAGLPKHRRGYSIDLDDVFRWYRVDPI
ncbi:hypothetical protein MKEN_00140100 [Mycena kentingensis (nom. inval.)]|nr:hypothetical protein MKEN_00140100 [Mycena kentingensis (nom. inval.)]